MNLAKSASHHASAFIHHHSHSESASEVQQQKHEMATPQLIEEEKQFIAHFADQTQPLPPDEVHQAPRNKELGRSSRALRVSDFDLVRTLGTGACLLLACLACAHGVRGEQIRVRCEGERGRICRLTMMCRYFCAGVAC